MHYIVSAAIDDYNANEEWCYRLLLRERNTTKARLAERDGQAAEKELLAKEKMARLLEE